VERNDLIGAFSALGARLSGPAEIIVAGGSALVLLGVIDRSTADADTISSRPKLSTFARDVAAVAAELGLASSWLNDGVTAYRDLLPLDFPSRALMIGTFGRLTVRVLWPPGFDRHEDGGRPAGRATLTISALSRRQRKNWRSLIGNSHASTVFRRATPFVSSSISNNTVPPRKAHDGSHHFQLR
jgi:Nucleotidyltransferase of unknown function (DUF6036)